MQTFKGNNTRDKCGNGSSHLWFFLIFFLFISRIHIDLPLFANTFSQTLTLGCLTLPSFPWGWSVRTANDSVLNQQNNSKKKREKLCNGVTVVLPATGRLSTNRAAESALEGSIVGDTTTAGTASRQLHSRGAFGCPRANLDTGTNLDAGALHTWALLQRQEYRTRT